MTQDPADTAVLYDLENMFGGYADGRFNPHVRIADIAEAVRTMRLCGRIAVHRAYANWSDVRLRPYARTVADLGIEPITTFGMGYGPAKNAADFMITLDAIELALTRPQLGNFILVTGDTGFAPLVARLRAHGRHVGAAAFSQSSGQALRAQCDEWLSLSHFTEGGSLKTEPHPPSKPQPDPKISSTTKAAPQTAAEVREQVVEALRAVAAAGELQCLLNGKGVEYASVKGSIEQLVPKFKPSMAGFEKTEHVIGTLGPKAGLRVGVRGSAVKVYSSTRELPSGVRPARRVAPAGQSVKDIRVA